VLVATGCANSADQGESQGEPTSTTVASTDQGESQGQPTSTTALAPVDVECRGSGTRELLGQRYGFAPGADANAQSLDVYIPTLADECPPTPIVVYVHGGGFRNGDKRNKVDDKIRLFNDEGWVFASVNYRLVGEPSAGTEGATYPRQPQDLAAAIGWLVEHADEIGGDPTRIMLMGHSAGAFLVALTSTDASFMTAIGVDPAAIVCTSPMDTETFDVSAQIDGGGAQADVYRNTFGDDPTVWAAASPVLNLGDDEPLPRFLFFTRGADRRASGNQAMAAAVNGAGGYADVVDAEPYTHEEVNTAVGTAGDTIVTPRLIDFFRSCADDTKPQESP
jgi:acetyl esterase/lipase